MTTKAVQRTQPVDILVIDGVADEEITALDTIADQYTTAIAASTNRFRSALLTANAIKQIEQAIELKGPIMDLIMSLMNSRLGFRTDKDPSKPRWNPRSKQMMAPDPYPREVVRSCAIEAMLMGVQLTGNEFNIIAGGAYITREGFGSLLAHKVPGLTNYKLQMELSTFKPEGAAVYFNASWLMDGKADSLDGTVHLKVHGDDTSVDAVMGKAERKAKRLCYNHITGSELADADVDDPLAHAIPVDAEVQRPASVQPRPAAPTMTRRQQAEARATELGIPTHGKTLKDLEKAILAAEAKAAAGNGNGNGSPKPQEAPESTEGPETGAGASEEEIEPPAPRSDREVASEAKRRTDAAQVDVDELREWMLGAWETLAGDKRLSQARTVYCKAHGLPAIDFTIEAVASEDDTTKEFAQLLKAAGVK